MEAKLPSMEATWRPSWPHMEAKLTSMEAKLASMQAMQLISMEATWRPRWRHGSQLEAKLA
jgi:hypothetical protein